MPKVMMIGKVSKLRGPTRRAGSFKGSLGTVVLEGSRAQSRRYGMGNIAGSPVQHLRLLRESLKAAREAFKGAIAEGFGFCDRKIRHGGQAMRAIGHAQANLAYADLSETDRTRITQQLSAMREQTQTAMDRCAASEQSERQALRMRAAEKASRKFEESGMSGARRRRRGR
jgi:hypothetical protein